MDVLTFYPKTLSWIRIDVANFVICIVQHVPKINGEIPSVDEEISDHQRLLDRFGSKFSFILLMASWSIFWFSYDFEANKLHHPNFWVGFILYPNFHITRINIPNYDPIPRSAIWRNSSAYQATRVVWQVAY